MKPRRIYCKYCNCVLVLVHKQAFAIIEVECGRCGESSIVKLFKGGDKNGQS